MNLFSVSAFSIHILYVYGILAATSLLYEYWFSGKLSIKICDVCVAVLYVNIIGHKCVDLRCFCLVHVLWLTFEFRFYCVGDAQLCPLSAVTFSQVATHIFSLLANNSFAVWASELTCKVFVIHLEWGCTLRSSRSWYSPLMHLLKLLPRGTRTLKVAYTLPKNRWLSEVCALIELKKLYQKVHETPLVAFWDCLLQVDNRAAAIYLHCTQDTNWTGWLLFLAPFLLCAEYREEIPERRFPRCCMVYHTCNAHALGSCIINKELFRWVKLRAHTFVSMGEHSCSQANNRDVLYQEKVSKVAL